MSISNFIILKCGILNDEKSLCEQRGMNTLLAKKKKNYGASNVYRFTYKL